MIDHQKLYFRTRDNGAAVYRLDLENRQRRLEMQQIATVNIRNGNIRPQGDDAPTNEELSEIQNWIETRRDQLAERNIDDILRAIDLLNYTAQWAQTKATDDQLERFEDALLLAMHDLRMVLVRRMSERLKG